MTRMRTNPFGHRIETITKPRAASVAAIVEDWEDLSTRPGMPEDDYAELKRRRERRNSQAHERSIRNEEGLDALARKVANMELSSAETNKKIDRITLGQVGLMSTAKQILDELSEMREEKKLRATESSAWSRVIFQSLIPAGALSVAIISLAITRC